MQALVDSRARDGYALLSVLAGREGLGEPVTHAMHLLATVLGQDLETGTDGLLRIARKVATDRVISTVDPQARHGHKTSHRGFDGYKAHIAIDPDSEIITATAVTAGNTGDAQPAPDLIADLTQPATDTTTAAGEGEAAVYGDSAYGAGEVLAHLHDHDIDIKTKVQPPNAPAGTFTKDQFTINLSQATVTCPNGTTITIRPVVGHDRHAGRADFGKACTGCPLREQCTASKTGRHITISRGETHLTAARTRQQDPVWQADYRATRPKVERKLAHLIRRRHGGRRARMRGRERISADFTLLAAATNLARLATLGLTGHTTGWTPNPA
uniref:transposase n=1 Tax=Paractinoplanes polyasparticus TaxID=2856853 RepID=UPI001C84CEF6|nr:transposase [Actinoplanes polyasparticus]